MSIRLIARELYQLIREIDQLKLEIEAAPYGKRDVLEDRLRRLKAERQRLGRILEGNKDAPLAGGTRRF